MLVDIETDEIINFPSIYKAAKFIDQAPLTITYWGKKEGVWNNNYKVILQYFYYILKRYNKIDFLI